MSPCATGQRLSELNTNVWPLCFSRIIKEMSASHSQQYSNAFRNRQSLRRVRCWLFARDVFFFLFPSVPFFAAIIYTFLLRAATYHERKWPCWVWLPLCSLTKLLITTCQHRWWWGFTLLEKVSTIVELFRINLQARIAAIPLSGFVHVCSGCVDLASPFLSAKRWWGCTTGDEGSRLVMVWYVDKYDWPDVKRWSIVIQLLHCFRFDWIIEKGFTLRGYPNHGGYAFLRPVPVSQKSQ